MRDDYLPHLVRQHYAQRVGIMNYVLAQRTGAHATESELPVVAVSTTQGPTMDKVTRAPLITADRRPSA